MYKMGGSVDIKLYIMFFALFATALILSLPFVFSLDYNRFYIGEGQKTSGELTYQQSDIKYPEYILSSKLDPFSQEISTTVPLSNISVLVSNISTVLANQSNINVSYNISPSFHEIAYVSIELSETDNGTFRRTNPTLPYEGTNETNETEFVGNYYPSESPNPAQQSNGNCQSQLSVPYSLEGNLFGTTDTQYKTCTGSIGTGGCTGTSCSGTASMYCSSCGTINPFYVYLSTCTPSSCPSGYRDDGVSCSPTNACNKCSGILCSYSCSYQQLQCTRTCTQLCPDSNYPYYCNSKCWGCNDNSNYKICCPSSGDPPNTCVPKSDTCYTNGCSSSYPNKCNNKCWSCSSSTTLCCPSSGDPKNCCGSGQVCQTDGICKTPCTNQCTSGAVRCNPGNSNERQTCYDTNSDGCTEWSTTESCAYGCSNGNCLAYCDTNRCGDGTCNCGETWQSCHTDCCKADGQSCSSPGTCGYECCSGECALDGICGVAACYSNSNCGTDAWVGNPFCQDGNVWQAKEIHTCFNAGNHDAYCSGQTTNLKKQDCTYGCLNGACKTCRSDGEACLNPGTCGPECCSGTCASDGICGVPVCYSNSDCGADTWVGNTFCQDGNVWQGREQHWCLNGGNHNAYCSGQSTTLKKQDCTYGCSNGVCITTATIYGYLKDESNNPIKNTKFFLTDCSDTEKTSAYTDSSGYFSVSTNAGDYKAKIAMPYGTLTLAINGNQCNTLAGSVNLGTINIDTRAMAYGYVKNEDGTGLQGAKVMFTDCSDNVINYDYTDSSGRFDLQAKYGSYKLKVEYNSVIYDFVVGGEECHYYSPGSYNLGNLPITTRFSISGYVKDESGNAISGTIAKLTDCSNNIVKSSTTGSDGSFTVETLEGDYKLKIAYGSEESTIMVNGNECNHYVHGAAYSLSSPVVFATKAHLLGRLVDDSDNPISGMKVKFTDCNDNMVSSNLTDSNGNFELIASSGSYKFKIETTFGTILLLLGGQECYSYSRGYIQITSPIQVSTKTTVHGYLKFPSGNPITGAEFRMLTCSGSLAASSTTDSSGHFSLNANSGRYNIKIVVQGHEIWLQDTSGNRCFTLMGDVDIGDLKISADCSVFDNTCYNGNWRLFSCFFDEQRFGCTCYYEICNYGCINGQDNCVLSQTGKIYVTVAGGDSLPLPSSKVYLDNSLKGSTDLFGKLSFSSEYGYRVLNVRCPNDDQCSTKTIYANGNNYEYFSCGCMTDSDGDGVSDSDEMIIGTDPKDANDNVWMMFVNPNVYKSCFDITPLISAIIGPAQRQQLISSIRGFSNETAAAFVDGRDVTVLLQSAGLPHSAIVNKNVGLSESIKESVEVTGIELSGGRVVFVVTGKDGVTSVFGMTAACVGNAMGLVAGAWGGLRGDIDVVKTVLEGIWYWITNIDKTGQILGQAYDFITGIPGMVGHLFGKAGDIFHDVMLGIFKEAANYNIFSGDKNDYKSFEVGYFSGYVVGYVAEQVLLLKGVSEALKAFSLGAKVGTAIKEGIELLASITQKMGGAAADVLSKTNVWAKLKIWTWGDEAAKIGAGRLSKILGKSKYVDEFLDGVADAKTLFKATDEIAVKYGDDVLEALIKSKAGSAALKAGWNSDELGGLYKMIDQLGETKVLRGFDYSSDALRKTSSLVNKYPTFTKLFSGTTDVKFLSAMDDTIRVADSAFDVSKTSYLKGIEVIDDPAILRAMDLDATGAAYDSVTKKIYVGNYVNKEELAKAITYHEYSHAQIIYEFGDAAAIVGSGDEAFIIMFEELSSDVLAKSRVGSPEFIKSMQAYKLDRIVTQSYIQGQLADSMYDEIARLRVLAEKFDRPSLANLIDDVIANSGKSQAFKDKFNQLAGLYRSYSELSGVSKSVFASRVNDVYSLTRDLILHY